jgi:hypothetical protein
MAYCRRAGGEVLRLRTKEIFEFIGGGVSTGEREREKFKILLL